MSPMAASLTHPIFLVPSPSVHSISEISVFKSHLLPLFCETLLPLRPGKVLPSQSHPVSANPSVSSFSRSLIHDGPSLFDKGEGRPDPISEDYGRGTKSTLFSAAAQADFFSIYPKTRTPCKFLNIPFRGKKKKKSYFLISWPTGNTHFLVIPVAGIEAAPLSYSFTGPLSFFTT